MKKYLDSLPPIGNCHRSLPLFHLSDGKPLLRRTLLACTATLLRKLAIHALSFWAGGASSLSQLGASWDEIKVAGRWRSRAVERYVDVNPVCSQSRLL